MNKSREVIVRVVRKRGHAAHHGGAWKVAFADFMTAMFALFLVLWLVNQSSDVKSAIAGYFQDPLGRADEFGSSIMAGEGAQAATPRALTEADVVSLRRDRLRDLGARLTHRLDSVPELASIREHVEITLVDEGLRIELLEDADGLFFESGRAIPSAAGQGVLGILGHELATLPNDILIEGHTDARPYPGTAYTNWELSADRANAARRIMVAGGLPASRVAQVRGLADREPRDPGDVLAPVNRRVTITVALEDGPAGLAAAPAGAHGAEP